MGELGDNLVIGGGPAGSMLAIRLARAGRKIVLLEKERESHHKVCGEFLSREAIEYLRHEGIEPRQLGAAEISRVRLTSGGRSIEERLPFAALSLSRLVFDEALLQQAQKAGCEIRRGALADRLERRRSDWLVRLRNAEAISARHVFLATGKHDLHAWERQGGTQTDLVGFKMHWRLSPLQTEALRNVMELFLFRGGYGGLSLIEEDIANLCFVVRRERLHQLGGWTKLIRGICDELPLVRDRLKDATACWMKPLAVSPIPYGYQDGTADGVWRLGDQAAVIPSFTGDGMSIALHSGALAAEMYLGGSSAEEYAHLLKHQLRGRIRVASMLSRFLVSAPGRLAAPSILSLLPGAITRIASLTRIPDRALLPTASRSEPSATQWQLPIA